tara:strand:- start:3169 stop:4176 length:1008 start_codon:yes stop_codon:yes gene_type:complete
VQNKISLIIPALSSNFYIEDFIINILLWKKLPNEIIIVNTSSKIEIEKSLIQKLKKKKVELIVIKKKNLMPGAARNVGILKSKYDYIFFLDMNTLPFDENWLKLNFDYLLKKKLDGLCGQTIYLANTYVEKIIRASTYGKAPLQTIPGSIFKKEVVLKVGRFDQKSRAGEDTDWLQRLYNLNFNLKKIIQPIFYKGLYNSNFFLIIKKWFRNYYKSASLPHLNIQKYLYLFSLFIILFIIVFNWNYSTLCFTNNFCLNNYNQEDGFFIPHVTKVFLLTTLLLYTLIRGIYFPLKKKISFKFLFPLNFVIITCFSFLLDLVKLITFLYLFFLRILN